MIKRNYIVACTGITVLVVVFLLERRQKSISKKNKIKKKARGYSGDRMDLVIEEYYF